MPGTKDVVIESKPCEGFMECREQKEECAYRAPPDMWNFAPAIVTGTVLAAAAQISNEAVRTGTRALNQVGRMTGELMRSLFTGAGGTDPLASFADRMHSPLFVDGRPDGLPSITVAYERHGAGRPVVFLHGIGSCRRVWDPVVPLLTDDHHVIAIDLPGFGQSADLPESLPRDLPTMVNELGAVFTELGCSRPHVVGHSLGGLIALRLAQAGLARSVTAFAPAGFWNEVERRYAFAVLAAARRISHLPEPLVGRLVTTLLGRAVLSGTLYAHPECVLPEQVITSLRTLREAVGFTATLRAGRARDLFIGDIPDVPVTIAWGTGDHILPRRQALRATVTIPGARLEWLPGCGHVPMNDAPDLVADIIRRTTALPPSAGRTGEEAETLPAFCDTSLNGMLGSGDHT